MEDFRLSLVGTELRVDGIADGVKLVRVDGPLARRLADLILHRADLNFANGCLDVIDATPLDLHLVREALWRSAIVHVLKCFGDGARFQLSAKKILRNEPPMAIEVFDYFKDLRNKHLVHDENSYAQGLPGAVLNNGHKEYKVEKIVCLGAIGQTLGPENHGNLKHLVRVCLAWVNVQFDELCDLLTKELEQESYEALSARDPLIYRKPVVDDLARQRNEP